jgi:hypothetical protein
MFESEGIEDKYKKDGGDTTSRRLCELTSKPSRDHIVG